MVFSKLYSQNSHYHIFTTLHRKNTIKRDSCSLLGYANLDYFICSQLYFNNLPMQTTTFNNNLIMIRHGQSNFNKSYLDYLADHNIDPSTAIWEKCLDLPGFGEAVSYAKQNIDAPLSPQGIEQCKKTKELLENEQIDIVLVSPYQRALETCHQIFGHRDIKVEVHPIIAQVFRFVCDIGHNIQQKKQQFLKFDFRHMQDADQLWFMQHLEPHHHETWSKEQQKGMDLHEKQQLMLGLLKDKAIYQTAGELRARIWKVKELLAEYAKKYKKIAIVSHYYIVKTLIATQFDENNEIINAKIIKNAEPYYDSTDRILQYK